MEKLELIPITAEFRITSLANGGEILSTSTSINNQEGNVIIVAIILLGLCGYLIYENNRLYKVYNSNNLLTIVNEKDH